MNEYIPLLLPNKVSHHCGKYHGTTREAQLHWHLDITFKEDACRARTGYASQNLSVLRKMALHIVSEQKDKLSLKKSLYKAALDMEYLKK